MAIIVFSATHYSDRSGLPQAYSSPSRQYSSSSRSSSEISMLKSGSTMPGGGRIPSLTIIFLYWRWMWLGCLSLATVLHFRGEKGITYRVIAPSILLHLVRNELPLQFVHLSLHLVLGLQQFRAVLRPDDREVVLQAPMSQRQLTISHSMGTRKLTRNDSAR